MAKNKTVLECFWEKVDKSGKDGCWKWKAAKHKDGYGFFHDGNYNGLAHRYSWHIHNGKIPNGGYVLHKCDNPECTNPEHLFLGLQIDNMQDMTRKGRHKGMPGEDNHKSKIDRQSVIDIIKRCSNGEKQTELSKEYGVTKTQINLIVNRKSWTCIPDHEIYGWDIGVATTG